MILHVTFTQNKHGHEIVAYGDPHLAYRSLAEKIIGWLDPSCDVEIQKDKETCQVLREEFEAGEFREVVAIYGRWQHEKATFPETVEVRDVEVRLMMSDCGTKREAEREIAEEAAYNLTGLLRQFMLKLDVRIKVDGRTLGDRDVPPFGHRVHVKVEHHEKGPKMVRFQCVACDRDDVEIPEFAIEKYGAGGHCPSCRGDLVRL
jgi:hypothetical protein